ncbi:MAG: hypothetical protein WCK02_13635 [Bacteroidota bacterium]
MRTIIITTAMAIALFSCKKDEPVIVTPKPNVVETESYMPLKIGNYWIYKNYDKDSQGNETERAEIDSMYISRDTLINGNTFYIFEGTNFPLAKSYTALRDSGDCIINNNGKILFSSTDFTNILNYSVVMNGSDTVYTSTGKMYNSTPQISTPAGLFSVLNFKCEIFMPHPNSNVQNPRFTEDAYAKGIGKVYKSFFFASAPSFIVKKLLRYHVSN